MQDANGCTNIDSIQINIDEAPTVTASAASTVCDTEPIVLNATGVAGSSAIVSYAWSGPNSFSSTSGCRVVKYLYSKVK